MHGIEAVAHIARARDLQNRDRCVAGYVPQKRVLHIKIQTRIQYAEINACGCDFGPDQIRKWLLNELAVGLGSAEKGDVRRLKRFLRPAKQNLGRAVLTRQIVKATGPQCIEAHHTHQIFSPDAETVMPVFRKV